MALVNSGSIGYQSSKVIWGLSLQVAALKIKTLDVRSNFFTLQAKVKCWTFPLDCMALYWEWSLWFEYASAFPLHFDMVLFSIN